MAERIAPIRTPMLVMGRDDDHLQGIFRVSYDVLAEAGKEVELGVLGPPAARLHLPGGRRPGRRDPGAGPWTASVEFLDDAHLTS